MDSARASCREQTIDVTRKPPSFMQESVMPDAPTPEEIATEQAAAAFTAALPPAGPKFAARLGDPHVCPMVDGVKPHVGGPILFGFPTVMIGGQPAARVNDPVSCVGPPDMIAMGSPTVMIGNMMAARFMDPTAHGGMIVMGCPTVIIGDVGMGGAVSSGPAGAVGCSDGLQMSSAKERGEPFMEPQNPLG